MDHMGQDKRSAKACAGSTCCADSPLRRSWKGRRSPQDLLCCCWRPGARNRSETDMERHSLYYHHDTMWVPGTHIDAGINLPTASEQHKTPLDKRIIISSYTHTPSARTQLEVDAHSSSNKKMRLVHMRGGRTGTATASDGSCAKLAAWNELQRVAIQEGAGAGIRQAFDRQYAQPA